MDRVDDGPEWGRAQSGDERALGSLFDRHHRAVFRYVLSFRVSAPDADALMAATFFELWRKRAAVSVVDGSLLPWLLVTATNLWRNQRRGSFRYDAMVARLPRSDDLDPAEVAVERIERERLRVRILDALQHLGRLDADLIALTVFDDLTPAQAAAALGISPEAARTRLHRARAKLRPLLVDLGADRELDVKGRSNS